MVRLIFIFLCCTVLSACIDFSDKYREIQYKLDLSVRYNPINDDHELLRQHISTVFKKYGGLETAHGNLEQYFNHIEQVVNPINQRYYKRGGILSKSDQKYLGQFDTIRFVKQTECFVGYEDFEDDTFPTLYDEVAKTAAFQKFLSDNGATTIPNEFFLAKSTERQINARLVRLHKRKKIKGDPIIISYIQYCRGGPSFANHLSIDFPEKYDFVTLVPEFGYDICQKLGRNPFSKRCKYQRQYNRGDDPIDIIGKWRYELYSSNDTKEAFVNVSHGTEVLKLK